MTFPQTGDDEIYAAYQDYQECCGSDGEDRFANYWEYVQDAVENYRHLVQVTENEYRAGLQTNEEVEAVREWLAKLEGEVQRHENLQAMRPQAYDPADPVDGEERGVTVNVRVWVAEHIDNPVQMIRDLLHESDDTPWLSILEAWVEDPE